MADKDLELGRPAPDTLHTLWQSHFRADVGPIKATAQPFEENPQRQENPDQDDTIVGVPRQKLEQLMDLWTEILQMSVKKNCAQDPESWKLAALPERHRQQPFHMDNASRHTQVSQNVVSSVENTSKINMVDVMTETEILAENQCRRSARQQWRPNTKYAFLEDSWKRLWEPNLGLEVVPFQWSHSEERRKALQLELIDAFNAQSGIFIVSSYMRTDFRSIASWVSLIGLRLSQIRSHKKFLSFDSAQHIEVLIECLWCCNTFTHKLDIPQDLQGPTVGDVLASCYRRRILVQPRVESRLNELTLREHFTLVRTALYLVNTLYKHRSPWLGSLSYGSLEKTVDIWNMQLSSVEASMRQAPGSSNFDKGKDSFCCLDDFNLKDLQTLGQLRIQWTPYWDEHLQLETSSTADVLKVYWFQPTLAQFLVQNRICTKIDFGERQQREYEICATWSILFTANRTEKVSRKHYGKLKAPKWMSLLAHSRLGTWNMEQEMLEVSDSSPELSQFMDKSTLSIFCFEIQEHLLRRWSKPGKFFGERVSYSQFPIYGDRLRELRAYMDNQKPKGLRALWRDRRNSNTYYTFWFVTIFGSLSIFLATCGLAVSVAQTWATFHTIQNSNN